MSTYQSAGDPILDATNLCAIRPRTPDELKAALVELGWSSDGLTVAMRIATSICIELRDDGLYHKR